MPTSELLELPTAVDSPPTIATKYTLRLDREGDPYPDQFKDCSRPLQVSKFLHRLLDAQPFEVLGTILLNARSQAIGHNLAYFGTLSRVRAEARGIFLPALLGNACRVIIFHNHPTGNPEPSPDDLQFTLQMVKAGKLLNIQVVDHIITGEFPTYHSFQEAGFAWPEDKDDSK